MQYTFHSAQCVQGVAHPAGEPDLTLFENSARGIRVILTATNVNAHLGLLNRHAALLSMMMQGMIGNPLPEGFSERLVEQTARVERQRLDSIGTDPVIIIELKGDIDAVIPSDAWEIQNFLLCFDAFDKKALRDHLQSEVSAVLTGLRIGADARYEFRSVANGSYLTTEDGRIAHSASLEAGALGMYISSRLTAAQLAQVASDIALALNAGGLERVIRLHAQSLDKATDNYRSFIASWSALEILIGKLFPTYQSLLAAELRTVSQAPGLHAYLDRIADVMGDKHSLTDKFSVLSVYLDEERRTDAISTFRALKKVRDQLSHGEDVREDALPTQDVQRLFEKYLRNHLRR